MTDTARTYHAVVCPWCAVQMVIRRAATDADGLSIAHAYRIVNRKAWKHVE